LYYILGQLRTFRNRSDWGLSALVLLAILMQAWTTQLLHAVHQHTEDTYHCDSENEKHIHSEEYAAHHCPLCDFTFSDFHSIVIPRQTALQSHVSCFSVIAPIVKDQVAYGEIVDHPQLRGPPNFCV
jgi:hypothetical protein